MATGLQLFISYSRADQAFASRLTEDLRAQGSAVWIDQHAIRAGTNWDVEIEKAVRASDCVLVILSPSSADDSEWVRIEIALALNEGKTVIPILHQPCKMPGVLIRRDHIDFTTSYEQGFARLLHELSASVPATADPNAAERAEATSRPMGLFSAGIPPSVTPRNAARKGRAVSLGVILLGLVLTAMVYALIYGPSTKIDEPAPARQAPPDAIRQIVPRERTSSTAAPSTATPSTATPSTTKRSSTPPSAAARSTSAPSTAAPALRWTPGQPHSKYPHVKAGLKEQQWIPEDGYDWLNSRAAGDFRVKWTPGVRHRQHPYVLTSETEGRWSPATGYRFLNPDDPKDLRVTPLSP